MLTCRRQLTGLNFDSPGAPSVTSRVQVRCFAQTLRHPTLGLRSQNVYPHKLPPPSEQRPNSSVKDVAGTPPARTAGRHSCRPETWDLHASALRGVGHTVAAHCYQRCLLWFIGALVRSGGWIIFGITYARELSKTQTLWRPKLFREPRKRTSQTLGLGWSTAPFGVEVGGWTHRDPAGSPTRGPGQNRMRQPCLSRARPLSCSETSKRESKLPNFSTQHWDWEASGNVSGADRSQRFLPGGPCGTCLY